LTRALVLAGPGPIGVEQLPAFGPDAAVAANALDSLLVHGFSLDALERDLIYAALDKAGGNKAAAARLLGITRRRLYSRLESLGQKAAEPDDDAG
jgi:DNA-binding NtrC family response regulator